ncbi:MAG: LuxR C-terminal-related transcriptional regulator [Acidobacteria bacterium]|nr:LuxR C-terminal-related transcriptional regulator [Acidobacteriota bacterium]
MGFFAPDPRYASSDDAVSEWVAGCERPVAWLSLDEGDNDPTRFLAYLIAALQTIAANIGEGVLGVLQSPQPPPTESILTALLNEITTVPDNFTLVLDDYHVIDARPVDNALTFLLEHLPPQMHLVIATREDPDLPLARLRVGSHLTELRVADLRFIPSEAAEFLNQVMSLNLSAEDIAALETRTEGWIAGLQLAAISMQGHQDATSFIKSFTGSHHFVMDYLVEEVLQQQSESVQTFLLRTSILDRMCSPLCDAVLLSPAASGQEALEYLEHANLFIVPLDNERRWYRYHHLFADLLRQRLRQSVASSTGDEVRGVAELHRRASQWYEDHGLEIEAFHHAAAANDVERAERLIEGKGMPLHFRGAVTPVLNWLKSLPTTVLDDHPSLWTAYASVLLVTGQVTSVEQTLHSAETALQDAETDDKTRDLIGRIAAIRATLAAALNQAPTIIEQSRRALEYLSPNNLAFRTSTIWKLGYAYQLQGDRAAASQAYTEVISIGKASGNVVFTLMATVGLGILQEAENNLDQAEQAYRSVLQSFGDQPLPFASEAYLGLARICYEWNDLDTAQRHTQQSIELLRQIEITDRVVACEVFLARLKLARGDVTGAAAVLAKAEQSVRQHNFVHRMPEVAAAQVLTLLRQGNLAAAAQLAETHELPLSQARVHLAQGDTSTALAVLEPLRRQAEAKGWEDERLKVMVLQAVGRHAHGEKDKAVQLLGAALALAEPGGFIRLFVDEGPPMAQLLSEAAAQGIMPDYAGKLLAVFEAEGQKSEDTSSLSPAAPAQPLIEPLSQRELEVLRLIAQGLSNREISERLFIALSSVKGHNLRIFGKLQVQRRTEAVARARELGLL